jgi:hypothetical protein
MDLDDLWIWVRNNGEEDSKLTRSRFIFVVYYILAGNRDKYCRYTTSNIMNSPGEIVRRSFLLYFNIFSRNFNVFAIVALKSSPLRHFSTGVALSRSP